MVGVKGPAPRTPVVPPKSDAPASKAPGSGAPAPVTGGWVAKPAAPARPTASGGPGTLTPATHPPATTGAKGTGPVVTNAGPPGLPKDIDEAFETMPCTSTGMAEVRRHADNVMAWNMKWDIVTAAKQSIDFSYFSIERDAYGYAYLGALLDAQLRGVQVTGVTDYMANSRGHGFISTGLGADYMQELVAHGAKIGVYDTLGTRFDSALKDGLTYKVLSSNHDKLSVADAGTPNAMGETGGRNVAGAYHQDPKDNAGSWRDDSVQLKGPATEGLVRALHRELNGPAVTFIKKDIFNIDEHATELLVAKQLMDGWMNGPPLSDAEKKAVRADPAKRQALADQLVAEAVAKVKTLGHVPERLRTKELTSGELGNVQEWAKALANDLELKGSRHRYDSLGGYHPAEVKILDQVGAASAAPGMRHNDIGPALFHLIQGAQKEIVIQNPYVVLTEEMMDAFAAASKRGVQITIVTNSPESTDSAVTQGFFLNDWKQFEERVPTARIFVATGERKFHSKAFVADGKVSGDTSYNADLLSGHINGEVGAVSRSEAVAQDLLTHIYDDLNEASNKFVEWTIQRDDKGNVVRGADGQPLAKVGPEQTVSKQLMQRYKPVMFLCDLITRHPLGAPLAHPK